MLATHRIPGLVLLIGLACLGNDNVARAQAKKSDAMVKVKAVAGKETADGITPITLTLAIEKGWHLYANPVGNEDFADNATVVTASGGVKLDVAYPAGKVVKDKTLGNYKVYEDEVKIELKAHRAGGAPIELNIKVQACNESRCLLPATIKTSVP
jgi:DsbC/DsbD-like thiol-disulfide interchange protein